MCTQEFVMITTKENKRTRFSIRATTKQKELIAWAAARSNKSISEFVLENSVEAAEALEAENAHFVVSLEDYDALLKKLDEPPRKIPALQQLMADPTSIDVPNH